MDNVEALRNIKERNTSLNGIVLVGEINWLISEVGRLIPLAKNGIDLAEIVQEQDRQIERLREERIQLRVATQKIILEMLIKDKEIERLKRIILESELWQDGPPCCICGYNGNGYFNPETHKCIAELQALKEGK